MSYCNFASIKMYLPNNKNMKRFAILSTIILIAVSLQAKTLIAYYSYTNNIHRVIEGLTSQIEADVVRIEPAEKGLDYAANNYAIGSAQIAAIRAEPDKAGSYPAIDPVTIDWNKYDTVIIGTPLWWSNMAAPMQTFLFQNGGGLKGKNIGLIVSSASSGISGVEADTKRLIPGGRFMSPSLWIRSSQTSSAHNILTGWLKDIGYENIAHNNMENKLSISANGHTLTATLVDNSSTKALKELLAAGPVTIHMSDYGNMEKVGPLPQSLPTNDEPINTVAGDLILYQGRNFVIYYDTNSWNFTRLGKIDNIISGSALKSILGKGDVDVTLTLAGSTAAINGIPADGNNSSTAYNLKGVRITSPDQDAHRLPTGVYIINGKKIRI